MENERLRYELLEPETFDPFELYEHVNTEAPYIEEVTEYVTWEPYAYPKIAFDWVDQCGEDTEVGKGVTYVLRPREGKQAGELAGSRVWTWIGTDGWRPWEPGSGNCSGDGNFPGSGPVGFWSWPSTDWTSKWWQSPTVPRTSSLPGRSRSK